MADSEVGKQGAAPGRPDSSRQSTSGAGWECVPGDYEELMTKRDRPLSWLSPKPLWRARNDRLVRVFGDPTNERRMAWMKGRIDADPDLRVDYPASERISFLVMGDTGEGDASQFAVVRPLLSQQDGTAFLFICSDVIYPAGGADEYLEKFFHPYDGYEGPIHAIPGNHDWYDDLTGFMRWFCGADEPPDWGPTPRFPTRAWWRDRLWRSPPAPSADDLAAIGRKRVAARQRSRQPGPYLAIDAGPVRLVGIDTGICGGIDEQQGEWLRRVSRGPKPKILLTGKPIYVDGVHHACAIENGGTVDDIVTDAGNNYIAAIGGDIHNYQRYPVELPDGRTLLYLVSGGGGAFMHETHTIDNLDTLDPPLRGMSESKLRLYPLRGDSLSRYSQLYGRKLRFLGGRLLYIAPDVAAAIVSRRLGLPATREGARAARVTRRARLAAWILFRLPGRGRRALHLPFSEWLDWNEPPFFKSFLRVDATADEVTIACFAATGCRDSQDRPPVEDLLRAARTADGSWEWDLQPGRRRRFSREDRPATPARSDSERRSSRPRG